MVEANTAGDFESQEEMKKRANKELKNKLAREKAQVAKLKKEQDKKDADKKQDEDDRIDKIKTDRLETEKKADAELNANRAGDSANLIHILQKTDPDGIITNIDAYNTATGCIAIITTMLTDESGKMFDIKPCAVFIENGKVQQASPFSGGVNRISI